MGNYLTFSIAGETCAVGVGDVESVLEDTNLGRISGAPEFVAGLLDLRGEAIPVIDVRKKLCLAVKPDSALGCIIVLSIMGKDGKRKPVGALVDSVSEVIELEESAIAPTGDFAVAFDERVVRGIAKGDSGFITMVAAERLFEAPSVGSPPSS
jgi:purine-binding chemotaxis protein CheW